MDRVRRVLAVAAAALVALALALAIGARIGSARFRARFEAEKGALLARGRAAPPRRVDPSAVAALPAPVRRYVEVAGAAGRPAPRVALLTQRGELRAAPDRPWMPFESEQAYAFEPPGFVWLAEARLAPGVRMLARDAFVDGRGNMLVRLLGAFTVADAKGPELDQGAGLRHWGEILSFPEAVLDPRLRWEPIDDGRARVRVDPDGLRLEAVLEFGADGLPVAFHAQRFRDVNGVGVLTPWSGRFTEWKDFGGRRFPSRWEAIWHLEGGDFVAVRMEILSVRTE